MYGNWRRGGGGNLKAKHTWCNACNIEACVRSIQRNTLLTKVANVCKL